MSLDLRLLEILEKRRRADLQQGATLLGTGGGGQPPRDGEIERRVRVLETSFHSLDKTLCIIVEQLKHVATREDLAVISGKLDTKASATELAELKGLVARIPTVPVLVSILILISLLFAAASWTVRHLPETWSRVLQ